MILLLRHEAAPEDIERLTQAIRDLDLEAMPLDDGRGRAFEIVGGDPSRVLVLAGEPSVETILTRRTALVGGEPLWPHTALRGAILAIGLCVLLLLLSGFFPAGLGDAAGTAPTDELEPAVEWYLRPLSWISGITGGVGPRKGGTLVLLFWLGILGLPFIDRRPIRTPAGRLRVRILRAAGVVILVMFVLLAAGIVS